MTRLRLLLRTLLHFRWANLAVIGGMAVATAVLTGALLVGDSVRGSLKRLALDRLGPVDHALVSRGFFEESLADRLTKAEGFATDFERCIPGIILRGGAATDDRKRHAAGVQIGALGDWIKVESQRALVSPTVTEALDLDAWKEGLYLSLPSAGDMPMDATFARRSRVDTTGGLRAQGAGRTQAGMATLFNLAGGQRLPRNVWVNLRDLQSAADQQRRANVLLVSAKPGDAAAQAAKLNAMLRQVATLGDYGLDVAVAKPASRPLPATGPDNMAVLTSRAMYLPPPVDRAAGEAATRMNMPLVRVLTYLANTVRVVTPAGDGRAIHYAVAAGISEVDGKPLADDEIVLNQWAADHLGAKEGDFIAIDYYQRQGNGQLAEMSTGGAGLALRVKAILPMAGLGADTSLTPNYKGLTDAKSIADWDPPEGLRIDKKLVTEADEKYWKDYRAAPKLLISLATAQRLWGDGRGELTSIRLPAGQAGQFEKELARRIDPAGMGMTFRAIKAQQVAAASGSTDFAELFVGFSFFLIAAAVMLLAMLLRLSIEQRARQLGLLAAVGFAPGAIRRLAMGEGMLLAVIGGLIGLAGAVGYTALMIYGLRTWWVGAIGTTAIHLHIEPMTLATGLISSLILALLTILWATRRITRTASATLLAGGWGGAVAQKSRQRGAWRFWLAAGANGLALGCLAGGITRSVAQDEAFMSAGFLLLVSAITAISGRFQPASRDSSPRPKGVSPSFFAVAVRRSQIATSLTSVGFRNASRHPARSLLTVALIAVATFILVTVASMKGGGVVDPAKRASGTGGYRLMLQTDIPLLGDLSTRDGRKLVGLDKPDDAIYGRTTFVGMRSWAGQDISCLNITKPDQPTILAVPKAMIERGGFARGASPLKLLDQPPGPGGEVPVLADQNTAEYILKLKTGGTLPITDQLGQPRKLVLAGTISGSIFQSQLLMSETNFLRLFPNQSGYAMVLVDTSADDAATLRQSLPEQLNDYSATVDTTAERLAMYKEVENTYLSTFQALGALGLMLGTVGLAVVLLRGLVERRPELALLSALGFRPSARVHLVLSENAMLLLAGMAAGALCALVAVAPVVLTRARAINPLGLVAMLGLILLVGFGAIATTVFLGARHLTPSDLRTE